MSVDLQVMVNGEIDDSIKLSGINVKKSPNSAHEARLRLADPNSSIKMTTPRSPRSVYSIFVYIDGCKGMDAPIFEGMPVLKTGSKKISEVTLVSNYGHVSEGLVSPELLQSLNFSEVSSVVRLLMSEELKSYGFLHLPWTSRPAYGIYTVPTYPKVLFDAGDLGQSKNKSQSVTIKQVVDRCLRLIEDQNLDFLESDSYPLGRYGFTDIFHRLNSYFYFAPITSLANANIWFKLYYAQNLQETIFDQNKDYNIINKSIVPWKSELFQKEGYYEYAHNSLIALEGPKPTSLSLSPMPADQNRAYLAARREVIRSLFPQIPIQVKANALIDSYPLFSFCKLYNSPDVSSSYPFQVSGLSIDVSKGVSVVADLSTIPIEESSLFAVSGRTNSISSSLVRLPYSIPA